MQKKSQVFVSDREAQEMSQTIRAKAYLECSSLTGQGVDDVFEAAARVSLFSLDVKESKSCCILL